MTIKLGTNVQSLQAQRRVGQTGDRIGNVLQRLSTGQRIVRASDDAASLAIAESLSSRKRVFDRGEKNISDGVSALAIAESAVEALTVITTRIYELAQQGSSGAYSPSQRAALDKEAQSLRDEFLRVVQSTSFNGRNLLDGSIQGLGIQAGYGTSGAVVASVGGKMGTGSFVLSASRNIGMNPTGVKSGDLNGDGHLDLVAANTADLKVLLGNGDGTFGSATTYDSAGQEHDVDLADFNQDGRLDIVTSHQNAGFVAVLLNNGNGTFGSASTFAVGGATEAVTTADFNGDGFTDILSANNGGNTLSVLLGNGRGSFGSASNLTVGFFSGSPNPESVATGDFNRDGRVDIVSANSADGTLSVFLGNGNGTFGAVSHLSTDASNPRAVTVSDLNGDGIADLAAAGSDQNHVEIFLGNGNGTFSTTNAVLVGSSPNKVTTADVNGDGRPDLLTTDELDDRISIALNTGGGTFQNATSLGVGASPNALTTGDFNNDGVVDIASADNLSSTLSVALNQTRDGVNPLLPISLKTQADSRQALSIVARKLELLSTQRGVIGAFQSRLLTAARQLASQTEGFSAAHARIRDADVATESAELTRLQTIQQSATAVLAQANQQPALALRLLRG